MDSTSASSSPRDRLEELVADCLRAREQGDSGAVDRACAEHPDLAPALRARMSRLAALGLADGCDPVPDAEAPDVPGFAVHECIGEGGMGQVWRAEQLGPLRRPVALKVIRHGFNHRQVIGRFESERQALALMSHPGIAGVHEAGATATGAPYFAMELIEGQPITAYCDERRLGIRARIGLFLEVCRAVHHAHQRGVLHRDLKPQNILVAEVEGRPQPKVIDFGLAKALDRRLAEHTLATEMGQILGTPEYMSPEQADPDSQDVDVRADVYGLGATLYELLVGHAPFAVSNRSPRALIELLHRIETEEPARPSSRAGGLDWDRDEVLAARRAGSAAHLKRELRGDLDWVVMRALAKDRERRYASALDLVRDLENHLANRPVDAGPPSAAYRLSKFVRRNRALVSAASVVLVVLLAGLTTTLHFFLQDRQKLSYIEMGAMIEESAKLNRQAERELWPMHPDRIPAFEAWLREAESKLEYHSEVKSVLASIGGRRNLGYLDRLLDQTLSQLDDNLETLSAWLSDVDERRAWAASLAQRSILDHEADWNEAIASIRDPDLCPAYEGLSITPQIGLVPLRRNEQGLWEFACLHPGAELPELARGEEGTRHWRMEENTCVILVLLPGGTFTMGAQSSEAKEPNYDPMAEGIEGRPHQVELAPFFLAKYEVTQGQWKLANYGENPSQFSPEYAEREDRSVPHSLDLTHPVENVGWDECMLCAKRMGLAVPTEAQWEYGARGGTSWPWWTGPEREQVEGAVNLCDDSCRIHAFHNNWETWMNDAWLLHAPVGSFRANPFGLHDVMGNVWEWVREPAHHYDTYPARVGDGLRMGPMESVRVVRGGGFEATVADVRITRRLSRAPTPNSVFGFRLARPLDREGATRPPR